MFKNAEGIILTINRSGLYVIRSLTGGMFIEEYVTDDITEIFRVYRMAKDYGSEHHIMVRSEGDYVFQTKRIALEDAFRYFEAYGDTYPFFFKETKEEPEPKEYIPMDIMPEAI